MGCRGGRIQICLGIRFMELGERSLSGGKLCRQPVFLTETGFARVHTSGGEQPTRHYPWGCEQQDFVRKPLSYLLQRSMRQKTKGVRLKTRAVRCRHMRRRAGMLISTSAGSASLSRGAGDQLEGLGRSEEG